MKQSNQSGFAAVEALLIVVILAIVGGTAYFVWHAKQNTDKSLSNTASTQPAIQKKSTTTKTTTKVQAASNDLVIKEWGITIPNGTSETFVYKIDGAYAQLSTQNLAAKDPDCSGRAAGIIQRASANDEVSDGGTTAAQAAQEGSWSIAHVGNYYYVYTGPQAGCSSDPSTNDYQNSIVSELRSLVPLAKASN